MMIRIIYECMRIKIQQILFSILKWSALRGGKQHIHQIWCESFLIWNMIFNERWTFIANENIWRKMIDIFEKKKYFVWRSAQSPVILSHSDDIRYSCRYLCRVWKSLCNAINVISSSSLSAFGYTSKKLKSNYYKKKIYSFVYSNTDCVLHYNLCSFHILQ